ncbi:hypothetical protein COU58_01775 [Candidatus Pacearchaeota archaeon CG10_big_fil_rev_8_21_14_0_10_32_42]|nr:MAG: hypothetical protein COU58_01775 [Candidatus Pacearchaeota archaeon CG10_big_fil_rev_8_21_14_0_10_32_42]
MKINLEKEIYFVGRHYDCGGEFPEEFRDNFDYLVYFGRPSRMVEGNSLEGIFCSEKVLNPNNKVETALCCRKDQLEEFEKKYSGKFYFFDKE